MYGFSAAARLTENITYYVVTAFVIVYVVEHNGGNKALVLSALVVANLVQIAATPLFGALSDRIGRRPVLLIGALGTAAWTFAFFPLLDAGSALLVTVAAVEVVRSVAAVVVRDPADLVTVPMVDAAAWGTVLATVVTAPPTT